MSSSKPSQIKHSTVFASSIRVIDSSTEEAMEAKASISNLDSLKDLLPHDIKPEDESDIIVIAANLLVAGTVNKNDDGLSREDVLSIYKKFERRFCDFMHNRKIVVGYIVKSALTEYGTNRVITEEEAKSSNVKFNVATVAILWRVINKDLCDFIVEHCSNPESDSKEDLSLSFEVGFSDYKIILLPKKTDNLDDVYAYISEDDKNFELYNAVLRKNGGAGTRGNYKVARLLCGKITPLGQGIVLNPASDVKGIIPIMENRVEVVAAPDDAKSTLPNENISPVTTLDGVGSKKPAQIDMNHAPIPPDLEIYPLVAASVSNKNNNSNNKNVKIKLNDELKSAVASQLVNVKQFSKDEEGNDFALASVKLVDGATVKDVKVYGTDYITITFDGAVEDLNIGEITVYVPFVDSQLVAKRTIDVNSADLLKILADIEKNVKKVKDSLKID